MTNKARDFAIKWHGDQMYGDKPYVYHLDQVADYVVQQGYDTLDFYCAVAYLHDILEDTECSYQEIEKTFGWQVASAVETLTKREGISYRDYIKHIKQSCIASVVKIADTKANLRQSILDNNKNRIVKYAKQLMLLEE